MNEKTCREIVFKRSQGLCERCGDRRGVLTLHHRKKRSQGGGWTAENCVYVDGSGVTGCHGWIESHPNEAEAEGWHVRPWQDPAAIPVLYWGSDWSLLTSDGGIEESDPPEEWLTNYRTT